MPRYFWSMRATSLFPHLTLNDATMACGRQLHHLVDLSPLACQDEAYALKDVCIKCLWLCTTCHDRPAARCQPGCVQPARHNACVMRHQLCAENGCQSEFCNATRKHANKAPQLAACAETRSQQACSNLRWALHYIACWDGRARQGLQSAVSAADSTNLPHRRAQRVRTFVASTVTDAKEPLATQHAARRCMSTSGVRA